MIFLVKASEKMSGKKSTKSEQSILQPGSCRLASPSKVYLGKICKASHQSFLFPEIQTCTTLAYPSLISSHHPLSMSAAGKVALARDATAESLCAGEQEATYGIFAAVAYPPPEHIQRAFSGFATSISGAFAALGVPASSYPLYAPAALHSSVATAYYFCRGAPVSEAVVEVAWDALLGEATSMATLEYWLLKTEVGAWKGCGRV